MRLGISHLVQNVKVTHMTHKCISIDSMRYTNANEHFNINCHFLLIQTDEIDSDLITDKKRKLLY